MTRWFIRLGIGIILVGTVSLIIIISAEAQQSSQPAASITTFLNSAEPSVRLLANLAIVLTCTLIILGGLIVFYCLSAPTLWNATSVQTLGTIFFFPTLILLAVYLELPKDAITTILGAFLGYLFGRSTNPGGSSSAAPSAASDIAPVIQRGPQTGGLSTAEQRSSELEPTGPIQNRKAA
jgi:hypothetical protein